jgi:hypothetical protein
MHLMKKKKIIQEISKFNEFYSLFQHLSFYLKYHEKQLIINLQDKITFHIHAAWNIQLIQLKSFNEIHSYLIYLNNEHWVMKKIKDKESMNKVRMTKQVIFAEKLSKIIHRKVEAIKSVNLSKLHDVILTIMKDTNL